MAKPDFAKGKGNGKANGKAKGNANRKPDSTIGKPDLTIEFDSVRAPELFPDEKGQVKLDASNVGEERYKGALEISLYASTNQNLDLPASENPELGNPSSDELLGTLSKNNVNLKPDKPTNFNLNFATPKVRTASNASPGAYYLFAEIDSGKVVDESNEDNNGTNNPQFVSADGTGPILDWNATLLNAIQSTTDLSGEPPYAAYNSALAHGSMFDAVNVVEQDYTSYVVSKEDAVTEGIDVENASPEAAAVEAAYQSLIELYPDQKATFDKQRQRSLDEISDGEFEDNGVALGDFVAEQVLASRSDENPENVDMEYKQQPELGIWRPTPTRGETAPDKGSALLPGWSDTVSPFAIPEDVNGFHENFEISDDNLGISGPPSINSKKYAKEIEEVRKVGAFEDTEVTERTSTAEQREIANFWSYDRLNTFRPQGQWGMIAQDVSLDEGLTLSENARLFGQLHFALADAGISAWFQKYESNQWRPITAIREAATNPEYNPKGITGDAEWEPFLDNPPFPDYTSGHSTFSGAAAEILTNTFGENYSFEATSQDVGGVARSYDSFDEAAKEVALSRIYGGVHTRSSSFEGLEAGHAVGSEVYGELLTPVDASM